MTLSSRFTLEAFSGEPLPSLLPVLQEACRKSVVSWFEARDAFVHEYSWAIPSEAALVVLTRHAPLVELGAGTGFWAKLLRERGVDVEAFDLAPPGGSDPNRYHPGARTWTRVGRGGPEVLRRFQDRTLFLCWPPLNSLVSACLDVFEGGTLVLVGEGAGGCTGFDDRLTEQWTEVEQLEIPQWYGLHDYLAVWKRHGADPRPTRKVRLAPPQKENP